jgi:tol-pal system protein YbgF
MPSFWLPPGTAPAPVTDTKMSQTTCSLPTRSIPARAGIARLRFPWALALAAACLATPAMAQRASLADRVALLEQQAAASQGNVELLNQITELRTELRDLRSMIEELQRAQEQQAQTARSQYLDLDSRITRLEGATRQPSTWAVRRLSRHRPVRPPRLSARTIRASATSTTRRPRSTATPACWHGARTSARTTWPRSNCSSPGDYAASARAFQEFLQLYPGGTHAPNALYWLGESYYVTQNYPLAGEQFRTLLDRYPTHDKAPGALLKLGLSQYGEQRLDAAEATLLEVTTRYPGTDAARTAEDRLRAIRLTGLR